MITENGVAFPDVNTNGEINDPKRIQFLKDYLKQVLKAKKEGVNVGGYFIWSFMDNFEWAEGNRPRFGLVGVDFKTQQRTIKASGKWFSDFLAGK
jgi:beta-glucosidase